MFFLVQVLGVLFLMVFLPVLYRRYKKDDIWSIFKTSTQYWVAITFILSGLFLMSEGPEFLILIAGAFFFMAGFLMLPPVHRFLPQTPLKHPLIISCGMIFFTLGPAYVGNGIQAYTHEKAKVAAIQEFAQTPDVILEGIRADTEGKRYEAVVDKAGLLLGTGHPEVEKLYAEAAEILNLRRMRKSTQEQNAGKRANKKQGSSTNKTEAYYMCKKFIKDSLNDPRSLDFPRPGTAHITSNGNTYDIAGRFRANNAFGAKVQSSYACTVTENRGKGTWTLDYLSEF